MASLVLIETSGTVKTLKAKELTLDTLYKKCGFRVNDDFVSRHTWKVKLSGEVFIVSVWAKKTGKANFENKYDFPPPIDKDLFFGTCAVVRTSPDGSFLDLTKEDWLKIYEKLFGGFEDIGSQDEYSEDELANVDPALLTKNGYLKDGFVVSDKEAISSGTPSGETSEEEVVAVIKKKKVVKAKLIKVKPYVAAEETVAPGEPTAAVAVETVKAVAVAAPVKKVKRSVKKADTDADATTAEATTKLKPKAVRTKVKVKEPEPEPEASEGSPSELEEEIYTFSDDD